MMLVFDTYHAVGNDPALRLTSWLAARTLERVAGARLLAGTDAVRARLDHALCETEGAWVTGVVLLAHGTGDGDAVLGADREPALDRTNVARLACRWAHAIACAAGAKLAPLAATLGCACFVGYSQNLQVASVDPITLSAEVRRLLAELGTAASVALHDGVRGELELMRRVSAIADAIARRDATHGDVPFMMRVLGQQLVDDMVVVGTEVTRT
ncbi:MAG: hypothetical protein HY908_24500 [Myxococcales bacterium]|nr:hypothetical protein [Myxococcales bacterium]